MAFQFGSVTVSASQIIVRSALSVGFVNISPVVPGHVLVASQTCHRRLESLSELERNDLFALSTLLGRTVERSFGCSSLTLAVQDGPQAGQTISHVHVHLIPRRGGDFVPNDAVYARIEQPESTRVRRSEATMSAEAAFLRDCLLEQQVLDAAVERLREHFSRHQVDDGHGIDHALKVCDFPIHAYLVCSQWFCFVFLTLDFFCARC